MRAGYLIDRDLNFEAVSFTDEAGEGLSIQRSLEPDPQDLALGQDGYCICLTTGPVVYGGVSGWSAMEDTVTIRLTAPAASGLGIPAKLSLRVAPHELRAIRSHLERLLG